MPNAYSRRSMPIAVDQHLFGLTSIGVEGFDQSYHRHPSSWRILGWLPDLGAPKGLAWSRTRRSAQKELWFAGHLVDFCLSHGLDPNALTASDQSMIHQAHTAPMLKPRAALPSQHQQSRLNYSS